MCLQTHISFTTASRAQTQEFLLRINEEELHKIASKLQSADEDFVGSINMQVQAILSAVDGAGGPYKLLKVMEERHVRTFLAENWEDIADINDPEGSGYDTDYIDYDMRTCQLFILFSWAHM